MSKALSQMKKRLEEAMTRAAEAEEIIPLLKEVIAKFDLVSADLFEATSEKRTASRSIRSETDKSPGHAMPMYRDAAGNTWAGKGRRPAWLNEALDRGKTLEDFRIHGQHLRRAK